ncbi:hypothetical protein Cs7R123_77820 [Catellatospora sp. TT07R-123]|uniref:glycosyltransferase n=1 Tax=Catellatospora sp. TT07R-123 TaxID=2733863 RepID=UPI001B2DB4F5|nr:glycosyltransferase [Catellatospora sp. TT07R-123]GHJ50440.1 hypothetical protein Cs7R123_77820 [Catellatospora sp. TT07R-123]
MTDGPSQSAAAPDPIEPDRPWLSAEPGEIDLATLRRWQAATDVPRAVELPAAEDRTSGLSVVVLSGSGEGHIARCLESLADQTLDADRFEIIVVLHGAAQRARLELDEFRLRAPRFTVRAVQQAEAGVAQAWDAGVAAASREYTVFLHEADTAGPGLLAALLAGAGPQVVAVAGLVRPAADGTELVDREADAALAARAGRRVGPLDLAAATSGDAPMAVATNLVKDIPFPAALRRGQETVWWTTVAVRRKVEFFACPPAADAVCRRAPRPEPLGADAFDAGVRQPLDAVAELDRLLPLARGGYRDLVVRRMKELARPIAAHLAAHPGDHGRAVDEVDHRRIQHMPYEVLTAVKARGLTVAYAFAPYSDTSAIVMAKRVRDRGDIVDVIQNEMSSIKEVDQSLNLITGPFVAKKNVLATPSYFADFGSMEAFAVAGLKVIERREQTVGPYEWVYSRAHLAASHFLAAAYKLKNPRVTWIAEFSDPLSRDVEGTERGSKVTTSSFVRWLRSGLKARNLPVSGTKNCFQWCEEIAYALADQLVFTNPNQLDHMMSYCADPRLVALVRSKAVISPQPTLPPAFYDMERCDYPLDPELVHVAYFGNFYATRGLDDVLIAIAQGSAEVRRRMRVHVFTAKPEILSERAAELGISENVVAGPYVRFLEFLNMTTKFDCLIVNDALTAGTHARNPYLPSKWSDYRGSGTPVWGLLEQGSPLSAEPLGYVSPVGDVASAGEVLVQLVQKKTSRF